MLIPQFLRFYNGYTLESVMQMHAQTFFSLANDMTRIRASETLDLIISTSAGINGDQSIVDLVRRKIDGNTKLLEEVRTLRRVRNGE